jgi:hypothetical protein
MTAPAFEARKFDEPDDRMAFQHGHAEVLNAGGRRLLRVTFEPGFRWSKDMAPGAGTKLCQLRHVFWVISGRMGLQPPDGPNVEVGAGELVALAPDHDSWTVGDEPVVFLDMDPKPAGS